MERMRWLVGHFIAVRRARYFRRRTSKITKIVMPDTNAPRLELVELGKSDVVSIAVSPHFRELP